MDICASCGSVITEDYVTFADGKYHYGCFNCASCCKSLAGESFLIEDGQHYCTNCHERDFAERCDVCGIAFKEGERQTQFGGQTMHPRCFKCAGGCGRSLAGVKIYTSDDQQRFCESCFKGTVAEKCAVCTQPLSDSFITLDGGLRKLHRHCYKCATCEQSLAAVGGHYDHAGSLYCRPHYLEIVAERCDRCAKPITGKYVDLDGGARKLHQDCYVCAHCNKFLKGGHYDRNGRLYCAQHQNSAPAPAAAASAATAAGPATGSSITLGVPVSVVHGKADVETVRATIKNAFRIWESLGSDPTIMCHSVVKQRLDCDDVTAKEVLMQFDTNQDGILQVDEFADAVLGLGLDLTKMTMNTAKVEVQSKPPDNSERTFRKQPTFTHSKEDNQVKAEEGLCVVCLDKKYTHLCAPCGHLCLCVGCSEKVMEGDKVCPVCRADVMCMTTVFTV